jgi:hypothetical protein
MVALDRLRTLGQPVAQAVMRQASALAPHQRHPLAPAAVRVERTRARGGSGVTEQTAVTLWFGDGPALPAVGGTESSPWKAAAGLGATLAGVAVMAAASTLAAQREEQRRIARARVLPALERAGTRRSPPAG